MVFFGFYCIRRLLLALNILLIIFSIVLLSVGIYANSTSIVNTSILGGIIFCSIFLFIISLVGLVGTINHHQVLLFFYMVLLSICFVIQFIIACTCLGLIAINSQEDLLLKGWNKLSNQTIQHTQIKYNCCGFNNENFVNFKNTDFCPRTAQSPCIEFVKYSVVKGLKTTGILALIFSFIDIFGVWLALRFRNQRDPKWNPNSFL